jgi:preprotein translocase subunit SecF
LVVAVICAITCGFSLRNNYTTMLKLKDAVYAADENNGDVQGALNKLRSYTFAHMNTNPAKGANAVYPPIQLKYTYERLQEQQIQASSNSDLYTQAQAYCQQQNSVDFSGRNRVPCIENYVETHGHQRVSTNVPASLYEYSFVSPRWSPDLAGWSMLAAILSFVLAIVLWITERIIRRRVA